ncbi:MAG: glycosyltransferase [Solirubrobacterales bacterium]
MARVLMVLRPSEGGAFRHVASLSSELANRGHEVAVCGPHRDRAGELDVEVIPVDIVRPLSGMDDARAVGELVAAIKRFAPDLIHTHGSKGGVMARLARLGTMGTPLISTPHGYAFAGALPRRVERPLFWLAERATTPLASRVICVCESEAHLARQFCPPSRIRVVHNGIEPRPRPAPNPAVLAFREEGPLICTVSGLRRGKGLETLLAAFSVVLRTHPHAKLLIVGGGPERDAIVRQIEMGDLGESVWLSGEVEDVDPWMAGADLFVAPSWSESFPYANLEAMALGLPIVATTVGGVAEAVEDGVSGILVAPRQTPALVTAILALLDDPARASALGGAALQRLESRFTLAGMVEATLAVYEEVIDAGSPGSAGAS